MRFVARKRRQPPPIIIISLIDILIVLLIFLMVTTTFKQQPSLKLALPESKQAKEGASDAPLVVTIAHQEPYFYLGARSVTLERLQQELASSAARNPKVSMSIRADAKAPLEQVIKVMDAARAANIKSAIELYTKKAGQQ
ncbi:MAG: biopolymer transporter ExbD [Verrucomicrobiota bacterium]